MPPGTPPLQKPKICFVSPYNYPLFNPDHKSIFGGWEVQIYHIAKEVARRGNFRASVIVADMGQPHIEYREGVELISWQGRSFWGITPPPEKASQDLIGDAAPMTASRDPNDLTEAAEPRQTKAIDHPGLLARIKKIYKRNVHWKVRFFIHGLRKSMVDFIAGPTHNLRAAVAQVKATGYSISHTLDVVGEMAIQPVMVAIFEEVGADVYVAPGVSDVSALTAWYCTNKRTPYIMLAGSDRDFNPEIPKNPDGKDLYQTPNALLLYTIQHANCHIVQNQKQAELAKLFHVSPVLIPNPIDLDLVYPKAENPQSILWVGNTEENVKQPSLMLDVIRSLPEYEFIMIVTPIQQDVYERLQAIVAQTPNIRLLSRVPFREVEQYYARAKLFVNTSAFEGFPNTFLQAGKYGVPIVSLNVDPNQMISKNSCGLLCGGEVSKIKENITCLMTDENLYSRLSTNIYEYVRQYHDPLKIIPEYERTFRSVLAKVSPGAENNR